MHSAPDLYRNLSICRLLIRLSSEASHHIIFTANCSWRDGVDVAVSAPADAMGARLAVNNCRLEAVGGRRLAWLMTLNASNRNWVLHDSEKHAKRMFLTREVSQLTRPGPRATLRPASPRRVAGVGAAKHESLMYEVASPGFTGLPQPGRLNRSGKL